MFNSLMMLAFESNDVVALRTLKLMCGGTGALHEAELMVREKIDAAIEATVSLIAGASGNEIVHRYREHVSGNLARLGFSGSLPADVTQARAASRLAEELNALSSIKPGRLAMVPECHRNQITPTRDIHCPPYLNAASGVAWSSRNRPFGPICPQQGPTAAWN
jgi:hypothetical protein